MSERVGDAPIDPQFVKTMNSVAKSLDQIFNRGTEGDQREIGFVLLVYPLGGRNGRCSSVCNGATQQEVVALFKELIANFEGNPEPGGNDEQTQEAPQRYEPERRRGP